MRMFSLLVLFTLALLSASTVSAQDARPKLDFIYEPVGQTFTPPPVRIVSKDFSVDVTFKSVDGNGVPHYAIGNSGDIYPAAASVTSVGQSGGITAGSVGTVTMYGDGSTVASAPDDMTWVGEALAQCTGRVMNITAYRAKIYLSCMRENLQPHGYTVLDLTDAQAVAAYYGVDGN